MYKVVQDPLKYFRDLMQDDAPYRWFRILHNRCLILNDAAALEHVLQKNFDNYRKSKFHKGLKPLLGNGIFLSEGALWKKQRKETAPFFSGKHIKEYVDDMALSALELTRRINTKILLNQPVDIHAECMWFTLDVVLRSLFRDPRSDIASDMKASLGLLLQDAEARIWNLVNVPQSIKVHYYPEYKKALTFLDKTVADLVEMKKGEKDYNQDFITVLSNAYDTNKDVEKQLLRDQIMSFLLAGHETSANALTWAFYELARNAALKKKAYAEIQNVCLETIDFDTVQKLPYLLSVFEEALRLYPPVWTMSREALGPDVIPLESGETIGVPKGMLTMLSPYIVHRSKRYWSHPEVFDPERFLGANRESITKHAYIPYGGGGRLCLGHKFANIEGVVGLARVLNDFNFSYTRNEDIRPEPLITLRPNQPIILDIRRRPAKPAQRFFAAACAA